MTLGLCYTCALIRLLIDGCSDSGVFDDYVQLSHGVRDREERQRKASS